MCMKRACELRAQARRCLRGRWGLAVGVSLVATLLSGGISVGNPSETDGYLSSAGHETWILMLTVTIASALVALCIGGAVQLGAVCGGRLFECDSRHPSSACDCPRGSVADQKSEMAR